MKDIVKQNIIELLSIPFVFVNIFYDLFPTIPLVFFFAFLSMLRTGTIGAFVLCSYAIPKLLGSALYTFGITGVAAILQIVMFVVCLFQWYVIKSIRLFNLKEGIFYLLLLLTLLVLSSAITSGGDFAITKILYTSLTGIITFFAYGFLLSNENKSSYIRVGLNLILLSLLMLLLSPLLNNGAGPESLLDFGYLRAQNEAILDEDVALIQYQHVGFVATMGVGIIMLDTIKSKPNSLFTLICVLLSIIISLYSGARQFIVISIVLLFIWALFLRKKGATGLIWGGLGIAFALLLVNFLFADEGMLNSVKEEGYLDASNRTLVMLKGYNDFLASPIIGVGFGRFEFYGLYGAYPHNMFLEILCELGAVGLTVVLLLSYKPLVYLIKNVKPCVYLLIVYFLRSMTSGGLDSNIMLFGFLFSVLCLKKNPSSLSRKRN